MLEPRPGQFPPDGVSVGRLADHQLRDLEWLLRGFLLKGELTILQGHGGTSKGTLAAAWASMVSRGQGECQEQPQHVLWAGAEDSIGTVVRPRLLIAHADEELVLPVFHWRDGMKEDICLPDDVHQLQTVIEDLDAGLLVIDPIMSHLSAEINSNDDKEIKLALKPLSRMAQDTGCAVLGVHHLTKDTSRGPALSGQGSAAFSNTARMVLAIAEDDEDEDLRLLEVVKTNLSKKGLTMQLKVEREAVPGLQELVPRLVRTHQPTDKTVHELLSRLWRKKKEQHTPGVFA